MKKMLFLTFTLLIFANLALADQCSTLPRNKANRAYQIIKDYIDNNQIAVIDVFCKTCVEALPKALVVDNVSLKEFQVKGYQEIIINKELVDLAYVYINGENLASIVDCKTVGVDKFL